MHRADMLNGIKTDADALIQRLREATDEAFARPTPCAAWDVSHLVAHLHRDFERVGQAVMSAADDPPDCDRVSYWHYDRAENQAVTQARARDAVERFGTPTALVDALDDMVTEALAVSWAAKTGLVVRLAWGPVMELDEFMATRWLELVVHSLDLATALGQLDDVSPEGLALVVDVLDRLAAHPLSSHWGASEYIRAATGRTTLTAEAQARLGADLAARFPLLA